MSDILAAFSDDELFEHLAERFARRNAVLVVERGAGVGWAAMGRGVQWRVRGMDAPYFDRTSNEYEDKVAAESIQRRRGGHLQSRFVSPWTDVTGAYVSPEQARMCRDADFGLRFGMDDEADREAPT